MNDEMVVALIKMEESGWKISGGRLLPEYKEKKAEREVLGETLSEQHGSSELALTPIKPKKKEHHD